MKNKKDQMWEAGEGTCIQKAGRGRTPLALFRAVQKSNTQNQKLTHTEKLPDKSPYFFFFTIIEFRYVCFVFFPFPVQNTSNKEEGQVVACVWGDEEDMEQYFYNLSSYY